MVPSKEKHNRKSPSNPCDPASSAPQSSSGKGPKKTSGLENNPSAPKERAPTKQSYGKVKKNINDVYVNQIFYRYLFPEKDKRGSI